MAGLLVAFALSLAGSGTPAAAQQAALVEVDAVRSEPLAQTVPIIARLVARQAGDVAARISGAVVSVKVEVGDRVKKGAIVAEINSTRLRRERDRLVALVEEAGKQVEQMAAEAALRRQELHRLEGLRDSVAFSQGRYEDALQAVIVAESAISVAEARRASAEATLAINEIDVYNTAIRAPYPGIVTVLHTEIGAWLGLGQSVISMVNDNDLEVAADVPTERIAGIVPGMPVPLVLDDGTAHQAVIRAVIAEENPLTRTRQVRFTPEFGTAGKPLAPGQSASVELPIGPRRDVVTVHKDAIITGAQGSIVYVAADGVAEIRPVRTGEAIGHRFEVLQGLGPGELVVVRGNERLQPGQSITFDGDS